MSNSENREVTETQFTIIMLCVIVLAVVLVSLFLCHVENNNSNPLIKKQSNEKSIP